AEAKRVYAWDCRAEQARPLHTIAEANTRLPREDRAFSKRLFDPQELVVLADAIGAARRAGLDLSGAGADGEVGDRRILRLTRSVRDDRAVVGVGGHLHGVERLGDRADLIQL